MFREVGDEARGTKSIFPYFFSGADSSSLHSPSQVSSEHHDRTEKDGGEGKWKNVGAERRTEREVGNSSIEEEAPTAANDSLCSDSIPSIVDEKGIFTATIYSVLKLKLQIN